MIGFDDILQQYGGDPASLLKFDVDGPELLPYATLTAARVAGDLDLAALGGVYEWQDRPLLFLVDGTLLDGNPQRLSRIRRLVAMRGDAPYLAVVTPGGMTIYQVGLDGDAAQARVSVVVECKLIDHGSGKGVDLYCNNGIARFVSGQYAWANSEAILIAYIRDGSSVEEHLSPFLAAGVERRPDPWQTHRLPAAAMGLRSTISSSHHLRSFRYPAGVGAGTPGNIALWHLWLNGADPA